MTKQELRNEVRERLSRLTPADIAAKSGAIRSAVLGRREWREARTICLFAALGPEPDLVPLCGEAAAHGKRICFPRVEGRSLEWFAVRGPEELAVSRWKLREPARLAGGGVPLSEIDLVLAPGLAFTLDGARLGRGGGYYDRLLAEPGLEARRIGVCFQTQIVGSLPLEEHDRRVDDVVTEA